jgi:hypothetical protein
MTSMPGCCFGRKAGATRGSRLHGNQHSAQRNLDLCKQAKGAARTAKAPAIVAPLRCTESTTGASLRVVDDRGRQASRTGRLNRELHPCSDLNAIISAGEHTGQT